nr:mechanosensitive ion channel [Bacteroidota bacterium]
MEAFNIQIIETLLVFGAYIISYFIVKSVINNALKRTQFERGRRKMTIRAVQLFTTITAIILLTGIWGFRQNEIALFASTILTALRIALFAQWSLLSNITSSILIFFNHPVKLGDYIKVLHKDYHYEGEVTEMNYFFVHIKTSNNEIITIPNSHFFDRSFSVKDNEKKTNS